MTIVVHLTEASHVDVTPHSDHVHLLRLPFAEAIAPDGLASVLEAVDGLGSTDELVVLHPDIDPVSVDRLTTLLRRSQRLRSVISIGHGLGPLGADLLVESLAVLLADPTVELDDAAAWCRRSEAMITDVVWTTGPSSRWARLDLPKRLLARVPGRWVRVQLGPEPHTTVATRKELLSGLELSGADVVVAGRDASDIARAIQQIGTAHPRSVRIIESGTGSPVVAEVVISATTPASALRPMSSA